VKPDLALVTLFLGADRPTTVIEAPSSPQVHLFEYTTLVYGVVLGMVSDFRGG
jgi:hypothetical protein